MTEVLALKASIYQPNSGFLTYESTEEANPFLNSLDRETFVTKSVSQVTSVYDEYATINAETCACGGVYGLFPITVAQVAFKSGKNILDALATQCLICGKEQTFIFDVTQFYDTPMESNHNDKIRELHKAWFTRVAHAVNDAVFPAEESVGIYFIVRNILQSMLHNNSGCFSKPVNLIAVKALTGAVIKKLGPDDPLKKLPHDYFQREIVTPLPESLGNIGKDVPVLSFVSKIDKIKKEKKWLEEIIPEKSGRAREEVFLSIRLFDGLIKFIKELQKYSQEQPTPETKDLYIYVRLDNESEELKNNSNLFPIMTAEDGSRIMVMHKYLVLMNKILITGLVETILEYVKNGEWVDSTILKKILVHYLSKKA